ncbi:hypothetical protein BCR39DRAFT_512985 [Naematelia encephala]|uniref:Alpha-1,6-mannosyl-glycoprotein 6-beta-N-acetylglucosaminyltransferase n=1 Tax=Naematelia encephala TaxID=71784 RepID=A0A1Y2BMC3_9TREE|nr:hypothetical protein BCR39DRAFT_512985 [Naematelia encephala]
MAPVLVRRVIFLLPFLTLALLTQHPLTSPYLSALYSSTNEEANIRQADSHAAALEPYFPSDRPADLWGWDNYKHYTESEMRKLAVCITTNTCRENQTTVVIYGHIHAHWAMYEGYGAGEGVWVKSVDDTLRKFGYTILHARDDWRYIWYIYNQIPDLVQYIFAYPHGQGKFDDYRKTEKRPYGIPAWKLFVYNYMPGHKASVVGDHWNVNSESGFARDSIDHLERSWTYLPYTITIPSTPPHIPTNERPPRIWILAKYIRYFYPQSNPAWPLDFFARASLDLQAEFPGFEFTAACKDDRNEQEKEDKPMQLPDGIRVVGVNLKHQEFEREVALSRGMLGIGWPTESPSPHNALSLGVPFLNPYDLNDHPSSKDADRGSWRNSQHHGMMYLDPPYVYHIKRNNYTSFLEGIRQALRTPIEQTQLPWTVRERQEEIVGDFMSTDWKSRAEWILEQRKAGVETQERAGEIFVM